MLFFTYDYSVATLKRSTRLLEEELKIYQKINEYGVEFIFLTYEENLEPEVNDYPEFKFIPLYKGLKSQTTNLFDYLNRFLYRLGLNLTCLM